MVLGICHILALYVSLFSMNESRKALSIYISFFIYFNSISSSSSSCPCDRLSQIKFVSNPTERQILKTTVEMMINGGGGGGLCEELVQEILYRLPIKSLFIFKLVCKQWNQLISTFKVTTFGLLNHYLDYNSLLYLDFLNLKDRQVVGGGGGAAAAENQTSYRNIAVYKGFRLLGSCNGLLVLVAEDPCCGGTSVYYVCNPIINKWVVLPQPHRNSYLDMIFPSLGFAFDGIPGHHYKVVYFVRLTNLIRFGNIDYEVFSSETGRWRKHRARIFNLSLLRNFRYGSIHLPSLYCQGKMYWIREVDMRSVMIVFHLEKEFFKLIRLPYFHMSHSKEGGWLWESEGQVHYCYAGFDRICVCVYIDDADDNDDDDCENKQNWFLKHVVMYEKFIIEVSVDLISTIRYITFDNDLELLYIRMKGIILSYSFETGRLQVAWRTYSDCNSVERFRNNGIYPYLFNHIDLPKWDGCKILEAKLSSDGTPRLYFCGS